MVDWGKLEKDGHELTLVSGPIAGTSVYYCENCGALMFLRNEGIALFHTHRGSLSEQGGCENDVPTDAKTLKSKLDELHQQETERLLKEV